MSTGAGIAVAMGLMNASHYAFTMVAARLLGPGQYGAMAAVMNLLLVISVGALGLQATAARRISAHPENVAQIEAAMLRIVWRVALGLGLGLLLLAPVVDRVLRLENLSLAVMVAVAAVPLTLVGGYAGILQGERRWFALGLLYMSAGTRLVIGLALLSWRADVEVAFLAVTLAAFAPVALGRWILRGVRTSGARSQAHTTAAILRETLYNSQALLAFFALSNVDVIVARNTLDEHDAGLYAAGLILAKMMTFLPQFVVVVAFPAMASAAERTKALTKSLVGVALLGMVCTTAVALLPSLVLSLVGGQEFVEIRDDLWVFALLGTALALLQLVIYSVLARQGRRSSLAVWAAFFTVVAGGLATDSLNALLLWVVLVDAALLTLLVGVSYYLLRTPRGSTATASALV